MTNAELDQTSHPCANRATMIQRGDVVEMSIDVSGYRLMVGFDSQSHIISSSSVEPGPPRMPRRDFEPSEDESDDEKPVSQWEAAGGFVSKAASLGQAVWSKWKHGPVRGSKLDYRVQCCFGKTMGGEIVNEPCPSMTLAKDGDSYCQSCGCGNNKLARLNPPADGDWGRSKLAYPYLKCPRDRFEVLNGD